MQKPNLFIVGAPKAGTTFLYEKLKNHPELFFSEIKELNHFSYDELKAGSYYRDYKIKDRTKYLDCYRAARGQKYIVDASVSYFAYPGVAQKIYEFNPSAKVIIILRDPYKRAFSHYLMDKRMRYAHKTFCEYINERGPHFIQYVGNSLYGKNVHNFINVFGMDNVLVMKLENIKDELDSLFTFLQIQNNANEIDTQEQINPNKTPKNFIASFFQKNRGITEKLKAALPKKVIVFFNSFLYRKADENIKISHEEIECLKKIIGPDLSRFDELGLPVNFKEINSIYA